MRVSEICMMKNIGSVSVHDSENQNNGGDPYANFRQLLEQTETFPTFYTYKLILKSENIKYDDIKAVFNHPTTKISESNTSAQGKYKSIAVQVFVNDVDAIIEYYKKLATIDSLMVL